MILRTPSAEASAAWSTASASPERTDDLDLAGAERNRAGLARQPERAERGPGKQPVDHVAEIGRNLDFSLQRARKQLLRGRPLDM